MAFTRNDEHINLRVMRVPRGPTLTFRGKLFQYHCLGSLLSTTPQRSFYISVQQYVLARDVISSLKKPSSNQAQFRQHPLVVMNNFKFQKSDEDQQNQADGRHISLMQTTLQNMFPSININSVSHDSWMIWDRIHRHITHCI